MSEKSRPQGQVFRNFAKGIAIYWHPPSREGFVFLLKIQIVVGIPFLVEVILEYHQFLEMGPIWKVQILPVSS